MKYLLGVGITVKKYRKDPRFRLYLGERMIDEFTLSDDEPVTETRRWILFDGEKSPNSFQIYVIDSEYLKGNHKFVIEIENNDSNYTNGFMTESTIVNPYHCFLIPIDFLSYVKRNDYRELCATLDPVIPDMFGGQLDFLDAGYPIGNETKWTCGYPFPFETYWKDHVNPFNGPVGGSGVFHVNIVERSNYFFFDPIEADVLPEQIFIDNHKVAPKSPPPQRLSGFPISLRFIKLLQDRYLDKYLHEDQ